jgi:hypothetical protein
MKGEHPGNRLTGALTAGSPTRQVACRVALHRAVEARDCVPDDPLDSAHTPASPRSLSRRPIGVDRTMNTVSIQ